MKKATNIKINKDFLENRAKVVIEKGYKKQKWVEYCEKMMSLGYVLYLYEARKTFSKYITVTQPGCHQQFKVRFSNHKPIKYREISGDCNFFVGVTNLGITTTKDAILATIKFFGGENDHNTN